MAKANSFWDFRLLRGLEHYNVSCDRENKELLSVESNQVIISFTDYDYTEFDGVWRDTSFIGVEERSSTLGLVFMDGKNYKIKLNNKNEGYFVKQLQLCQRLLVQQLKILF